MTDAPLVSVIVTNYNYGRFVRAAIDGALSQTYPHVEVIVVDDGSTDDSRARIASYGHRVRAVFKENGGQASSFNAGFAASSGSVVVFLDADDVLLPQAVETVLPCFEQGNLAKVHWPLWEVDQHGERTGQIRPRSELPAGHLREFVLRNGPSSWTSAPTSGNAWSRGFLAEVMPMPECEFRICADAYLNCLAPIAGPVARVAEPLSLYRRHAENSYARLTPREKFKRDHQNYSHQTMALQAYCNTLGLRVDPATWSSIAWFPRVVAAAGEIEALVAPQERFILVDEDQWAGVIGEDREVVPFLERDGTYWGPPPDDETAISELERLRQTGATHIVFAWPAFWWLEYYQGFSEYLHRAFRCVLKNDHLVAFDLRE